ncbi:MAG: tripartite tricarboxylate transporter substrate binding protein [Bacteroidota bacterium]|jgi:tripartite-type tricarboxylate transporter receptor subunit TctC
MMSLSRLLLLLLGLVALGVAPAQAQSEAEIKAKIKSLQPKDYPKEPLEFVVVYPAGGGMDVATRILAKYVEKWTGHKTIVTNKVGGGGMVGHTYLATQAPNDGYVIGVVASFFWDDGWLRSDGKFDYTYLEPLAFINYDPTTWIVRTDGPLKDKNLKDIVAMIKEKPGELKVGVVPVTSNEFIAEQLEALSGTGKFTKVPFQGGAPSITALLGGHVDISFGYYAEYRGHLEAGKVKVIGQANTERVPIFKDVPTFNEQLGVNDIVWLAWRYAGVPRGTPADRKAYLEAALNAALNDPELAVEYGKTGSTMDTKRMNSAKAVSDEVNKLAKLEHDYFVKTGRIKK